MSEFTNVLFAIYNWVDEPPVSSATSNNQTVSTGSKTFTVARNSRFFVGGSVTAVSASDSSKKLIGTVSQFNFVTGYLVMNVTAVSGTGSASDFVLTLDKWTHGSWKNTLPLSNLVDNRLYRPARSSDATADNTKFRCDFSGPVSINSVCGVAHNFSEVSEKWIRLYTISDSSRVKEGISTTSTSSHNFNSLSGQATFQVASLDGIIRGSLLAMYSLSDPRYVAYGTVDTVNPGSQSVIVTITWRNMPTSTTITDWVVLGESNWSIVHDSGKTNVWPLVTSPTGLPFGVWSWQGRTLLGDNYRPPFIHLIREQFTVFGSVADLSKSVITDDVDFVINVSDTSKFYNSQIITMSSFNDNACAMSGKVTTVSQDSIRVKINSSVGSGTHYAWTIRGTVENGDIVPVQARFMDVSFLDTTNPDGFIEIGRLITSAGFQPEINMSYGSGISVIDESKVQRSRGGQVFGDVVPKYRQFKINLEFVKTQDMMSNFYELQNAKGVTQPILVILNAADPVNLHRYTLYGSLDKSSDMTWTDPGSSEPYMQVNLVFNEWVGG